MLLLVVAGLYRAKNQEEQSFMLNNENYSESLSSGPKLTLDPSSVLQKCSVFLLNRCYQPLITTHCLCRKLKVRHRQSY